MAILTMPNLFHKSFITFTLRWYFAFNTVFILIVFLKFPVNFANFVLEVFVSCSLWLLVLVEVSLGRNEINIVRNLYHYLTNCFCVLDM